jgi:hypothetical protein
LAREYRKHPVPVAAMKLTAAVDVPVSWQEKPLSAQAGDYIVSDGRSFWPLAGKLIDGTDDERTYEHVEGCQYVKVATILAEQQDEPFEVETPEGVATGDAGDWLAQGPGGEAWPIRAEQFAKTYEEVNDA